MTETPFDALLRERVDQLASLARLSESIARAADVDEAYAAALDCLAETLSPDRASVLVFDDEGVMRFRAWRGLSEAYRRATEGHSPWSRETKDPAPVLVTDVAADPSLAELRTTIEREGIRTLGFFPLLDRDRLLGKFMIYFDEPHVFNDEELRLAQAVGAHITLELARRQAENERRIGEQRARDIAARLQSVTESLARTLTVGEVADVVVRQGAEALGAAAGWVAVADEERRKLRRIAAVGYRPGLEASYAVTPLEPGRATGDAVLEGRAVWLGSAAEVVAAYPALTTDYAESGFEAMAIVPLAVNGHSRGVVVLNFTEVRDFREDERRLLAALVAQCGQAMERADLYTELRSRADAVSVLAHVGDGVFQLDFAERVTLWNRGAEVLTDVSEGDALGRQIGEIFGGWEEIRPRIAVTDVPLAIGRRVALPAQVRDRELWLAISGVESNDGIVFAFRDVTEAEKLEQVRRDFLATASHELRTPLAAVFGATKTLLHHDLDGAMRRRLLEVIGSESDRLAHILDEILFASRLDAGRVELEIGSCDLVALAREVIELEQPRLPEDTTLTLEPADDEMHVLGDPGKLRQVVLNLVDNAIKYSPAGGPIVVSLAAPDDRVQLSVADAGLGIPSAEHERIFEKFYRLDPQMTRGVGGTGLGLYISREFVGMMGGRISVASTEDEGSTFTVELPRAR